jgi:solute carrier family 10 (sodium/bile acid cotransporter), member 7
MNADSAAGSLTGTVLKLTLQVFLPVILGILLNKRYGAVADRNKVNLKYFDQAIILSIVYTSFAESFLNNRFAALTAGTLLALTGAMIFLFFIAYYIITTVCVFMKFNRGDTIAAVFCGSKKSLIHGTVMSKVLFSTSPLLGVILLPLMIYHAAQIVIASVLAGRFSRRVDIPSPQSN